MHQTRSLERYGGGSGFDSEAGADKENTFKTRITVITPDQQRGGAGGRKPYKTTINTATDNIQYRGIYQRPKQPPGGPNDEMHYKVRSD